MKKQLLKVGIYCALVAVAIAVGVVSYQNYPPTDRVNLFSEQ